MKLNKGSILGRLEWAVALAMIGVFLYAAPYLVNLAGDQLMLLGQTITQQVTRVAVGFLASLSGLGALLWSIEHFWGWNHGKEIMKKVLGAAAATFGMPAAVVAIAHLAPHLVDRLSGVVNGFSNSLGS
jgi:hypothetical protein